MDKSRHPSRRRRPNYAGESRRPNYANDRYAIGQFSRTPLNLSSTGVDPNLQDFNPRGLTTKLKNFGSKNMAPSSASRPVQTNTGTQARSSTDMSTVEIIIDNFDGETNTTATSPIGPGVYFSSMPLLEETDKSVAQSRQEQRQSDSNRATTRHEDGKKEPVKQATSTGNRRGLQHKAESTRSTATAGSSVKRETQGGGNIPGYDKNTCKSTLSTVRLSEPSVTAGEGRQGNIPGFQPNPVNQGQSTGQLQKSFSANEKKSVNWCPIPRCYCTSSFKQHVMQMHIPSVFYDFTDSAVTNDPVLSEKRVTGLRVLADYLLGSGSSAIQLVAFLNKRVSRTFSLTNTAIFAMKVLCEYTGWKIPATFTTMPLNHPAVLIHWAPMVYLLSFLSDVKREKFYSEFHDPAVGKKMFGPEVSVEVVPNTDLDKAQSGDGVPKKDLNKAQSGDGVPKKDCNKAQSSGDTEKDIETRRRAEEREKRHREASEMERKGKQEERERRPKDGDRSQRQSNSYRNERRSDSTRDQRRKETETDRGRYDVNKKPADRSLGAKPCLTPEGVRHGSALSHRDTDRGRPQQRERADKRRGDDPGRKRGQGSEARGQGSDARGQGSHAKIPRLSHGEGRGQAERYTPQFYEEFRNDDIPARNMRPGLDRSLGQVGEDFVDEFNPLDRPDTYWRQRDRDFDSGERPMRRTRETAENEPLSTKNAQRSMDELQSGFEYEDCLTDSEEDFDPKGLALRNVGRFQDGRPMGRQEYEDCLSETDERPIWKTPGRDFDPDRFPTQNVLGKRDRMRGPVDEDFIEDFDHDGNNMRRCPDREEFYPDDRRGLPAQRIRRMQDRRRGMIEDDVDTEQNIGRMQDRRHSLSDDDAEIEQYIRSRMQDGTLGMIEDDDDLCMPAENVRRMQARRPSLDEDIDIGMPAQNMRGMQDRRLLDEDMDIDFDQEGMSIQDLDAGDAVPHSLGSRPMMQQQFGSEPLDPSGPQFGSIGMCPQQFGPVGIGNQQLNLVGNVPQQMAPIGMGPVGMGPVGMGLQQMGPVGMDLPQMHPLGMGPSQFNPGMGPQQVDPVAMNQQQFVPGGMTQQQLGQGQQMFHPNSGTPTSMQDMAFNKEPLPDTSMPPPVDLGVMEQPVQPFTEHSANKPDHFVVDYNHGRNSSSSREEMLDIERQQILELKTREVEVEELKQKVITFEMKEKLMPLAGMLDDLLSKYNDTTGSGKRQDDSGSKQKKTADSDKGKGDAKRGKEGGEQGKGGSDRGKRESDKGRGESDKQGDWKKGLGDSGKSKNEKAEKGADQSKDDLIKKLQSELEKERKKNQGRSDDGKSRSSDHRSSDHRSSERRSSDKPSHTNKDRPDRSRPNRGAAAHRGRIRNIYSDLDNERMNKRGGAVDEGLSGSIDLTDSPSDTNRGRPGYRPQPRGRGDNRGRGRGLHSEVDRERMNRREQAGDDELRDDSDFPHEPHMDRPDWRQPTRGAGPVRGGRPFDRGMRRGHQNTGRGYDRNFAPRPGPSQDQYFPENRNENMSRGIPPNEARLEKGTHSMDRTGQKEIKSLMDIDTIPVRPRQDNENKPTGEQAQTNRPSPALGWQTGRQSRDPVWHGDRLDLFEETDHQSDSRPGPNFGGPNKPGPNLPDHNKPAASLGGQGQFAMPNTGGAENSHYRDRAVDRDRFTSRGSKARTMNVERRNLEGHHNPFMGRRQEKKADPLEGFDSYFMFDKLVRRIKADTMKTGKMEVEDTFKINENHKPDLAVDVVGGLMVFNDPALFKDIEFPLNPKWKVAVGIDPARVHTATPDRLALLQSLAFNPLVSAIGGTGLDYTQKKHLFNEQEETLMRVAGLCSVNRPLILHIRERTKFQHEICLPDFPAHMRCLEIVKKQCDPDQRIMIHCFTGDTITLTAFTMAFPNCMFSFGGNVDTFDVIQNTAMRSVPLSKLLIETMAPYGLKNANNAINTPAFIGVVAKKVAERKMMPVEVILRETVKNARRFFGPPKHQLSEAEFKM